MNQEDHFSKFFLIVAVICLVGLLIWSPTSSSKAVKMEPEIPKLVQVQSPPKVQRVKGTVAKTIEEENCYQYEGDSRWFYTSSDGVELYWDEALKCFRIDGKIENGETVADNPDGKRFQLKEGKWVYHQKETDIDWRIDPQGRYYLKEREGRYIAEKGHALVRTFQGWMVDDGPRVGSQRLQWGVDVNGYFLKSTFKKEGYHGVVLPSGLELRWRPNDLKSLEYLNVSKSASEMTWVPKPLGQLSSVFKLPPDLLYKEITEERLSPQWDALVTSFESASARDYLKGEIQKTFGVTIRENSGKKYLPQFLICVALTLDCYPKDRIPSFLRQIDYVSDRDWAGLAHPEVQAIEIAHINSGRVYSVSYLLRTLHHEYGHNISLVRGLGFDWNEFRSINPTLQYTNVYDFKKLERPEGSKDTARDYGLTNEREDVATITEFLMTDPTDLSPKKSDFFKKKYAYLSRFYNNLFGFHFNPDYMNNRVFEPSLYQWEIVAKSVPDLPAIRLE